ncbi:unnamed protein product (macronuclear) [Paramecium tetraurelia]|uniref:Uncharacterized protein n=1 Tax=Paramecium tetraurelia TaxID=5888 RepID=A0CKV3_PARTE|nr:uncharacterized protein GSPATT00007967001 [Paramecium tetraurelia]CAK71420.1 unnamed protein product [Paramecium tetraurelia]|eukprot:XP_001438817.1 hypothetical protein (macronuclear) [Paramecium tetraurelia strain d4-2]
MQSHPMVMVHPNIQKQNCQIKKTHQTQNFPSKLTQVLQNSLFYIDGRLSKELNECSKHLGITRVDVIQQDINHQSDLSYLEDHIKNYDVILQKFMYDLTAMDARISMVNRLAGEEMNNIFVCINKVEVLLISKALLLSCRRKSLGENQITE